MGRPAQPILLALVLLVLGWVPVRAQQGVAAPGGVGEGDGLIVRILSGDLVFIDKGAENGVARGDLFDVVSSEILVHPLSDSILAVTPVSVGAVQVLQVYPRTALARLIYLDGGQDPMLKPIARVRDPERIGQIEAQLMRGVRTAAGLDVSRRVAVVPGLYQLQTGQTRKGWGLLAAEAVTLTGAFIQRHNSNTWYEEYSNLGPGLNPSEYTRRYEKAVDFKTMSNRLFWLAGALYVYNWVDVLWLGEGGTMAQQAWSPGQVHLAYRF